MTHQLAAMQGRFFERRGAISIAWVAVLFAGVAAWFSLTLSFAFIVLAFLAKHLWNEDGPPYLAFALAYQWCFIVAGVFYQSATGTITHSLYGNIDLATTVSLLGLVALASGITTGQRFAISLATGQGSERFRQDRPYDIEHIFYATIAIYSVNWFVTLSAPAISFTAAQVILFALLFRTVFIAVLFLEIVQQRHKYGYGVIALLFVMIPEFVSIMSAFKEVVFVLLVSIFAAWTHRPTNNTVRRVNRHLILVGTAIAIALAIAGVAWEGFVKPAWRPAVRQGTITGTPFQRITAFGTLTRQSAQHFSLEQSLEILTRRFSSATTYFSLTLDRVPALLPHENGAMTGRALKHLATPRFLFPNKPVLPSDSWLVRRYAGVYVAGAESATSVGLGYMAQFYIDFGPLLMFLALLLLGVYIGVAFFGLMFTAPSRHFFWGSATVVAVRQLTAYEGELTKLLGGLTMNIAVFMVIFVIAGPTLHRTFLAKPRSVSALRGIGA